MNQILAKDLKFGLGSENTSKKYLEYVFGPLTHTEDKFAKFDFYNENFKVELKTRRCKFGQYPDLYFEKGKIHEGVEWLKKNPDGRCFFLWRCINDGWGKEGFYFWEYNEDELDFKWGGRDDRGKDEYKMLVAIKNKWIKPLFTVPP
tara:strand:+ start:6709 stop:7149 length:441 start_codon:yes stop_codon:yes gene_type:complete